MLLQHAARLWLCLSAVATAAPTRVPLRSLYPADIEACHAPLQRDTVDAIAQSGKPIEQVIDSAVQLLSDTLLPAAEQGCWLTCLHCSTEVPPSHSRQLNEHTARWQGGHSGRHAIGKRSSDERTHGKKSGRARINSKHGSLASGSNGGGDSSRTGKHTLTGGSRDSESSTSSGLGVSHAISSSSSQDVGKRRGGSSVRAVSGSSSGSREVAVAALLVASGEAHLQSAVGKYAAHALSHWQFAARHGHELLVYTQLDPLPPPMKPHFSKLPAFHALLVAHSYDFVLFTDWDSYIDPRHALQIPEFSGAWPRAGAVLQYERNLCSCVIAFRRGRAAAGLLAAWWAEAQRPPYAEPHRLRDQAALKNVLQPYLLRLTGERGFLPAGPPWRNEPPAPLEAAFERAAPHLFRHSIVGFAGLLVPPHNRSRAEGALASPASYRGGGAAGRNGSDSAVHVSSSAVLAGDGRPFPGVHGVALHSCMAIWWGCLPVDAPALVHHHSHMASARFWGAPLRASLRAGAAALAP